MKDDTVYLKHIYECIRRIQENITGGRDKFMASHTLQDAVLRNLQTMTEATQRLSERLKSTHPEIEWARIVAFRNVLVHNYLGVDMDSIWEVLKRDVPALKQTVLSMLKEITK